MFLAGHAVQHHDHTLVAPLRRADKTIARLLSMAGFQSISPFRAIDQRVAIALLDAVTGEFFLGKHRIEKRIFISRKFADHRRRQNVEVARGCGLVGMRPAGCILEHGVQHAELPGSEIHFLGKTIFGTRDTLGKCNRCIISRLHDNPMQKVTDRNLFAHFNECLGAALAPRFLGDKKRIIKRQTALFDPLKGDEHRHDLRH